MQSDVIENRRGDGSGYSQSFTQTGRTLMRTIVLWLLVTHTLGQQSNVASDPATAVTSQRSQWTLCAQLIPHFDMPCLCKRIADDNATTPAITANQSVEMDCDGVSVRHEFPSIPPGLSLRAYSHRHAGLRNIEGDVFAASHLPLRRLDFSHNRLQRLPERLFHSARNTLVEVQLGHNRLGSQLNPVFATNEFGELSRLHLLDLGSNGLRALEDGVFRGLHALQTLHLDANSLDMVPLTSLHNLANLVTLSLQHNRIDRLKTTNFASLSALLTLNLSSNLIANIDDGAFTGMENLTTLDLSNNKLPHLHNPNAFVGLNSLRNLDLNHNFLSEVPSQSLRSLTTLTHLNLASNGIRELRLDDFTKLSTLVHLDLSGNRIAELPPTIFQQLTGLATLLLDANLVHKLESRMFDGLQALQHLSIDDNNVLVLPELDVLPALTSLTISYNRIAAVSSEMLLPLRNLRELMLDFNLVREIPPGTFHNFTNLQSLSLRGNILGAVSAHTFEGLERTVQVLHLGANSLTEFPSFSRMASLDMLDLSENRIDTLPDKALTTLPSVRQVNLRANRLGRLLPSAFPDDNILEHLDLSGNVLQTLDGAVLARLPKLRYLDASDNEIGEIEDGTFHDMLNLENLDLANNKINLIRHNAIRNLPSLRLLNMSGNLLSVMDGQIFGTHLLELRVLDLSRNHIHYIIPSALTAVGNLQMLDLSTNKLTVFLEGTLHGATYLESLVLANNQIQHLDNGQFAHTIRLRTLDFSHNLIEAIGEGAFTNSSQIRFLDLSHNQLAVMPDNVFNGIARLALDLSQNNLSSLPANLFARHHVGHLESVNLAGNQFTMLPMASLNEQYAALETLQVEGNRISHIPADTNALVNVKYLDVSDNPLSKESIQNIFGEPKTVQTLRAANCGITELSHLETPFLHSLNLSGNLLQSFPAHIFQRATMLTTLLLANNRLGENVAQIWSQVPRLKRLDLSGNLLRDIGPDGLGSLTQLETLDLSNLGELGRFDHETFRAMTHLRQLSIHGYPRLGFYDVRSILESTPALESLEVEVKGTVLRDQLHPALNSRLYQLIIYGDTLQNLTSVSFAGLLAPSVRIALRDTAIATVPNTIFLPLPASMDIELDLAGNRVSLLGPQLLATLNKKRHHVRLSGLASNPLYCDCFMKPMLKWMRERIADRQQAAQLMLATCAGGPDDLRGRFIWQLREDELLCERQRTTTMPPVAIAIPEQTIDVRPPPPLPPVTTTAASTEPEPDIIYEAPTARPDPNGSGTQVAGSLTNIDSMIIVIIVGVVAFVCILIIIICIIKLRHSRVHYHGGPMAMAAVDAGGGGACTCVKQPSAMNTMSSAGGTLCHCHPNFPPHSPHSGPLPPKLLALHCESRNSSLPRSVMHGNPPYHHMPYPESNADYR